MYNIDPTLVRLIAVALTFFSGFTFLVVYVICAIIIPLEPTPGYILSRHRREGGAGSGQEPAAQPPAPPAEPEVQTSAAGEPPAAVNEAKTPETPPMADAKAGEEAGQAAPKPEGQESEILQTSADETVVYSAADRY